MIVRTQVCAFVFLYVRDVWQRINACFVPLMPLCNHRREGKYKGKKLVDLYRDDSIII